MIGICHLSATTLKSLGIIQGRELLRYTTRIISDEKMNKINNILIENEHKQKQLEDVFEKKRQENIERERIEKEREKVNNVALSFDIFVSFKLNCKFCTISKWSNFLHFD